MKPSLRLTAAALTAGALSLTLLAAPADAVPRGEPQQATIMTGNVDFGLKVKKQKKVARALVRKDPDIILLQETRELNLARFDNFIDKGNKYQTIQYWQGKEKAASGGTKAGSAILVKRSRYTVQKQGLRQGYYLKGADPNSRYLPWVQLKDINTGDRVIVVSVHMPAPGKDGTRNKAAYSRMVTNYRALIKSFPAKRSIITGGDWNKNLAKDNYPVKFNKKAGLKIKGTGNHPCAATRKSNRLDGFAVRQSKVDVLGQKCLKKSRSDHAPVRMTFKVKR